MSLTFTPFTVASQSFSSRFNTGSRSGGVVPAEPEQMGERHATRGRISGAGVLKQQAVAQHAEHGLGDQLALVRADAFVLEKIAQRGVGGMRQRQGGTQCPEDEIQTVFGDQHSFISTSGNVYGDGV